MMASFSSDELKLLEETRISPPPGSLPPTKLPLTFFDVLCYRFIPVQRLFLFQLPTRTTTLAFLQTHLPNLKHSLSIALELFYLLSGNLLCSGPEPPCLSYAEGDGVALVVYESTDDFHQLIQKEPVESFRLHRLVPKLSAFGTDCQPAIALQLTVFPEQGGIAIGIATHHGVADGHTSSHFIRTWASLNRSQGKGGSLLLLKPPILDRSTIKDPNGILQVYLAAWEANKANPKPKLWDLTSRTDVVRATFLFTRTQLEKLQEHVQNISWRRCSAFSVTCGASWVSFVRAKRGREKGLNMEELERFLFLSDCRGRLEEYPIGEGYFGNCICFCMAKVERRELLGEEGTVRAVTEIWGVVEGLKRKGCAMSGAEGWVEQFLEAGEVGTFSVSGSPRHGVYSGVDFGWGRAKRVEVTSVETRSAMCLAENRDEEEGGYEVGIGLPREEMEVFAASYNEILRTYCS